MTSQFDKYLSYQHNLWHWNIPTQLNICDLCISQHATGEQGKRAAFIVEDNQLGTTLLTYQTLDLKTCQFANLLNALGIGVGDRVLIRLPNAVEYPIAFFGCLRYGAIAVPTSTLLTPVEVAYLAQDSGARMLVTHQSMWPDLAPELSNSGQMSTVILTGQSTNTLTNDIANCQNQNPNIQNSKIKDDSVNKITHYHFDHLMNQQSSHHNCQPTAANDPAYLVYTSGTTGYPKGVLHAHRALIGRLPASRYWFDFRGEERILHSGKFNWTYVLGSALMDPLFHGQTVVVYEGPNDPANWPKLIQKHQCTIFIAVPTIYRQIIEKTAFNGQQLPSLRHCMSAGEHLSDEMLARWQARFSLTIYEAIGMSEFSYYISQNKNHPVIPGSAGFIQPGHDIKLLNKNNQSVGIDEEGIIAIPLNDPGLFLNYWQLPEQTESCQHDGYFFTGDYAKQDQAGYIWFLGRKDDIINTFGYRVSPLEIEQVFKTHPAVADCVAVAENITADKTIVSLCVILVNPMVCSANQLLDFGEANLAKYKAPKKIYFFNHFPRTKNGKVLRSELKQQMINYTPVNYTELPQ
ncbi:acyl-CoA synthetase [Aliikangiella maris]|uniref:Acyl-CoA synthetase n=2 Tax=Aliikangiella maris TaxID=3162458 RepID=A0ABV2BV61_9GAMM